MCYVIACYSVIVIITGHFGIIILMRHNLIDILYCFVIVTPRLLLLLI